MSNDRIDVLAVALGLALVAVTSCLSSPPLGLDDDGSGSGGGDGASEDEDDSSGSGPRPPQVELRFTPDGEVWHIATAPGTYWFLINADTNGSPVAQGDEVVVANEGPDTAPEFEVEVGLSDGASAFPCMRLPTSQPVRPGHSHSWTGPHVCVLQVPAGAYSAYLQIDPRNALAESDESNNVVFGSVQVIIE